MGLLYTDSYRINDDFSVYIPTIDEILSCQDEYYRLLSVFISTPFDLMVQLDDIGIDFTEITKYQLFVMLFRGVLEDYQAGGARALDLILKGYDFNHLYPAVDLNTQSYVFVDDQRRVVLNERLYLQIRSALCYLHDIDKKDKRPGNQEGKKYLLERARIKQERARRKHNLNTELEDLIVALVNCRDFKYDFDSVRSLSLYKFNRSLQQILKRVNYDQIMQGYYAGNLDIKKISQESLNWLSSQKE